MEPDIIIPIPNTDLESWVWIQSVEITRQGTKLCPGTSDKWKISLPLKASLARNGELITTENGLEISVPCPLISYSKDVSDIIHHPEVAALLAQIRDTTLRLVKGLLPPVE